MKVPMGRAGPGVAPRVDRGLISPTDWRRPRVRWTLRIIQVATLLFLLVFGLTLLQWRRRSHHGAD